MDIFQKYDYDNSETLTKPEFFMVLDDLDDYVFMTEQ